VQVWDLGSGSPVRAAVLETGGQARALAFQAGDLLVLARRDAGAQFQRWDLALGVRTKMAVLNSGETAVEAAFSADLLLAATRGATGPVRIWRLSDGLNLATTREGLTEAGPLAFSPDGRLLAVGYPDKKKDYLNTNRVRIWRVPAAPGVISDLAYEVSAPATGEGSTESLISLAWSADGKYLAAGFED
jgi:WD40 repeat protein